MKTLIKLIIAGLLIHATWRAGVVYWRYYQFKDGLQETAQFSGSHPEGELQNRAFEIAKHCEIPIDPDHISVRREANHTIIEATYEEQIEILPRYYYPWPFKVSVDAFTIMPKRE